jgi:hypothetical protein
MNRPEGGALVKLEIPLKGLNEVETEIPDLARTEA